MTVRGAGPALPAGCERLRPSLPRRFPIAVVVAYFASTAASGHHSTMWWALLVLGALVAAVSLRDSLTLTPTEAIVVQGPRIRVPWDRVQAVVLVRGRVALVTGDRRGMVRAPALSWDPKANEAARARIEQWWIQHRGPNWTPADPATAVFTFGYMLPWAIAVTRGKSNAGAIGLIDFLTGWTLVGWVVALVLACLPHQSVAYVPPTQPVATGPWGNQPSYGATPPSTGWYKA